MESSGKVSNSSNSITGEQLRQIRLNIGMSQAMFASLLGVSTGHCCRLENGKLPISDRIVQRLTNLIGVSDVSDLSDLSDFSQFQESGASDLPAGGENTDDRNADDDVTRNAKTQELNGSVALRRFDPYGYERDGHEGDRIRILRKAMNIRQEQFAAALGVSISWIRKTEGGSCKPSDKVLGKIIEEFNVNPSWLLRGEGEMGEIGVSATSAAAIKKRKSRKLKKIELKDDAQIRYEAIRAVETGEMSITESCKVFGFSRETYYKYKRAYEADGIVGLIMEHKGPWGHRRGGDEQDEHRSKHPM